MTAEQRRKLRDRRRLSPAATTESETGHSPIHWTLGVWVRNNHVNSIYAVCKSLHGSWSDGLHTIQSIKYTIYQHQIHMYIVVSQCYLISVRIKNRQQYIRLYGGHKQRSYCYDTEIVYKIAMCVIHWKILSHKHNWGGERKHIAKPRYNKKMP